jgi:adenylate cyclase
VPLTHEDDDDRGVRCAVDMMRVLNQFNIERKAKDLIPVDIGVGVNSDSVVSGNIGSPKRMDYTVIGDGVNLAARLESACKQYGAHVLVSEYTIAALKGTFRSREVDLVVVKGKTQPVGVHEILDYHTPESFPNVGEVLGLFKDGLGMYRSANFTAAKEAFLQALSLNPDDKASTMYVDRCDLLLAEPPPEDWDGVWVMQSK